MSVEGCRGERTIGAALPGVQPRHVYEHVAKADSAGSAGGMEAALSPDTAPAQIRPLGGHGDVSPARTLCPRTGDEGEIGIGRSADAAGPGGAPLTLRASAWSATFPAISIEPGGIDTSTTVTSASAFAEPPPRLSALASSVSGPRLRVALSPRSAGTRRRPRRPHCRRRGRWREPRPRWGPHR